MKVVGFKAQEHLVQHRHGAGVLIEIIGVREEVALQPVGIAQGEHPLEEGELKVVIGGGLA